MQYFNGINIDILEPVDSKKKVLDFGSGSGDVSAFFLKKGSYVTSIDINESSRTNIESSLNSDELSRFNFIHLDAENEDLPLRDKYDIIICREVLEHIKNFQTIITQFHKVLNNDGILIISVPSYLSEKYFSFWDKEWLGKSQHVNIFKKSDLNIIFRNAKFSLFHSEGGSFKWFLFWALLAPFKVDHSMGNPIGSERKVSLALDFVNKLSSFKILNSMGNKLFPKSYFYYLRKYKPRILVVYDYHDWILGRWAKHISEIYGNDYDVISMSMFHALDDMDYTKSLINKCDIIHLLLPHCYDYFSKIKGDALLISTIHHWIDWNDVREAALNSDALVTGANEWKEKLVSKGIKPGKITVVHSGVEERFFFDNQPLIIKDEKLSIGFFAKLDSNEADRKGTRHFQEIIRIISERGMARFFRIIISGPGWDNYLDAVRLYGIEIHYLGFVEDDLLPSLYKSLDVYLMLSDVEGGPVTVPEAMASRCLVLSTNIGVSRDIISNKYSGIFVNTTKPDDIVTLLEYYYRNRVEMSHITNNAYNYALGHMKYEETFKPLADMYEKLSANIIARNDHLDAASINTNNIKLAGSVKSR